MDALVKTDLWLCLPDLVLVDWFHLIVVMVMVPMMVVVVVGPVGDGGVDGRLRHRAAVPGTGPRPLRVSLAPEKEEGCFVIFAEIT